MAHYMAGYRHTGTWQYGSVDLTLTLTQIGRYLSLLTRYKGECHTVPRLGAPWELWRVEGLLAREERWLKQLHRPSKGGRANHLHRVLKPASVAERAVAAPLGRLCGATLGAAPLGLFPLGRLASLRQRGSGPLPDGWRNALWGSPRSLRDSLRLALLDLARAAAISVCGPGPGSPAHAG